MFYRREDYTRSVSGDIKGGLTSGIVAIPVAVAFGIASGAGAIAGLYGAIIVGLFAAIFGGTRQQISGPTGPMTVIMTTVIMDFIQHFPETWLALSFSTVILAGLLQVLMGICRLGKYIVMVPYPVISGFMSGIGLIIILLQLPTLLGVAVNTSVTSIISTLPQQMTNANITVILFALLAFIIQWVWRGRYATALPPALVTLVTVTILSLIVISPEQLPRIGEMPSGLPEFVIPQFNQQALEMMLKSAIMLAILGAIDSLLTSLVLDNISGEQHNSDRELIGQGIGNSIAGFCGALPGAGATMRSIVNYKSGGRGPLSGVVHSILLISVVLGFGAVFSVIPHVVLAAILVKVGIDIIDWPFLKTLHKLPIFPVCLMFLVMGLTVFVDLITAVFVGVFIKNIDTVKRLSDLQLGDIEIGSHSENTVFMKITGPISYAVGRGLNKRYRPFREYAHLTIDLHQARIVGYSTSVILIELVKKALASGQTVNIVGADNATMAMLERLGILSILPRQNITNLTA